MKLNRKQIILKYIVEDYVKTAQPVGSNSLLEGHKFLNLSSATVRNVMAELEKNGLLEKTHTSSGRIPSIEGYRYYINYLRNDKIDNTLRFEIDKLFDSSKSIEQVLNESCQILSHKTNLATCILNPSVYDETLVKVEAVPTTLNSFTIIFVTNKGYVENKNFVLNKNVSLDYVLKIVEFINVEIKGTKVLDVTNKLSKIKLISNENVEAFEYVVHTLISTFSNLFMKRGSRFYGKKQLLEQPEFKDNINELKKIFELFLNSDKLAEVFSNCGEEISISIGNGKYKDISIITKDIRIPKINHELGRIAVVGPTRMDYDTVIQHLNYTVKMIINHLNDLKEVDINE